MLKFFTRMLNNKEGFTLIEVLVVVAIIGILAALAAPMVLGRIEQARVSNDEALARQLTAAVEQYVVDAELSEDLTTNEEGVIQLTYGDLVDYLDGSTQKLISSLTNTTIAEDNDLRSIKQSRGTITVVPYKQGDITSFQFEYEPAE